MFEDLLAKAARSSININRLRILCLELYKTINNLDPDFMKEFSTLKETNRSAKEQYKWNLEITKYKQTTFSRKGLRAFGPKVLNSLTHHIKSSKNSNYSNNISKTGMPHFPYV